jgi:hypothetical protein
MLFAPESPVYLYKKNSYERAHKVVDTISRLNKGEIHEENWRFDKEHIHDSSGKELLISRICFGHRLSA